MKKTVLAMILGIMTNMVIFAQGYPVIDITNIIIAIENGYTMMQQLQTMYNTLKTSYDQLQKQIKTFESFDFSNLDAKDPLGSWRAMMTYADRMMTYEENIADIINKKNFHIGNASYSLMDIFTSPPNKTLHNMTLDGIGFIYDPFETRLTTEEKAVFHQKYGMTYGHYMRYSQLGEMLQKKAAEVTAYSINLQENLTEDREKLNELSENLFNSDSAIQQQQVNNAIMTNMAHDIKTQAHILGNISEQIAMQTAQEQIEKQAKMDQIHINDIETPEEFLNMVNDIQSLKYR